MWEENGKARAAVPTECSLSRVLGALVSCEWQAFFVKCMRKRLCEDAVRVLAGDVQTVFEKSEFISGGDFLS